MASKDGGFVETIKTLFWAGAIAIGFRTLLFQPFFIPSESMKETLLIGDFLFVNKMAYGYSRVSCPLELCPIPGRIKLPLLSGDPERGDVVVFRHPVSGQDYIKRLIGLPGDKIQMKGGVLFINGEEAKQVPDGVFTEVFERQGGMGTMPRCSNAPVGEGGTCEKIRAIETLPGGRSHPVLDIDTNGYGDNSDIFTVPEGEYFFMGDNRDNSMDSRYSQNAGGVGFVPAENLIGRADRIMFSSAGRSMLFFWTWRSDRYFKAIE